MHTIESLGAGHKWSVHPYVQWIVRKPNGFAVFGANDVRRFDSEATAQAYCDKLNKVA